jgi:ABC-type branched-subunit amino acid transport system ATPase component
VSGLAKTTAPLLRLDGVVKSFGGVRAVQGVSLDVAAGSLTGLIGPNGAGKSTIIAMIAGAIRPDSGSILLEGREISGLRPFEVARLGVIRTFQTASVFNRLTVLENMLVGHQPWAGERITASLFGRRSARHREEEQVVRARQILDQLSLAKHQDSFAGDLSGGQKRLVEIGRALMARPRLLLLDEPMAGVSKILARPIEDLIAELRKTGMTVILIEHNLGLVERLCSPVVVLAQGRVLKQGEMDECRADPDVRRAYLVG